MHLNVALNIIFQNIPLKIHAYGSHALLKSWKYPLEIHS